MLVNLGSLELYIKDQSGNGSGVRIWIKSCSRSALDARNEHQRPERSLQAAKAGTGLLCA